MPSDHAVQATARMIYETASHGDGARHTIGTPHQMVWADLRDPDLVQRFRHALEQLERLCYALFGSRPLQYAPYIDWTHRLHPRCLWGPEQWEPQWCVDLPPNCNAYYWHFHETGALGDNGSQAVRPIVPGKSRSGDPMRQMLDTESRAFNREHVPIGSVTRSGNQPAYGGQATFDPRGTGDFGGDPAQIGADGDVHIDGDDVTITYTPPEGAEWVPWIDGVKLHWDNGSTSDIVAMTATDGVWSGVIPAQSHNTEVRWWLELEVDLSIRPGGGPIYTVYEPGDTQPPTVDDTEYTYVAYSHWSPYPYGLPELWDLCAKGTDRYAFTPDETIQPALINLARFILTWIGDRYSHSPKLTPDPPACCVDTRIRWRWSGSAPWPHLVGGGKDPDDHISPLHNRSDPASAVETARFSWRGADKYYGHAPDGIENDTYGDGVSWLPIPERLQLDHWAAMDPNICDIYFTGRNRGLREGDVIERAHLEEIIHAVDYLVTEGLWTQAPVKVRKITPDWAVWEGHGCGEWDERIDGYYASPHFDPNQMRCYADPFNAIPYDPPDDWDACWNEGPHGVCRMAQWRQDRHYAGWDGSSLLRDITSWKRWQIRCSEEVYGPHASCLEPSLFNGDPSYFGGGWVRMDWGSQTYQGDPFDCAKECWSVNCGWGAYLCGPERCPGGCDASHGNAWSKPRWDEGCPAPQAAWTGRSHGNCFGDTHHCGIDVLTDEHRIAFESVRKVWFRGGAYPWMQWDCGLPTPESESTCSCGGSFPNCFPMDDRPEIPGYDDYLDLDGAELCTASILEGTDFQGEIHNCGLHSASACGQNEVWVAVDLHLDALAPYARHPDHPYPTPPAPGTSWPLMSNLRPYAPNPDPEFEPLITYCPCATWTSAWGADGPQTGSGQCVAL